MKNKECEEEGFNMCSECGIELSSGEDGHNTTWGTCHNCVEKGEDDES